MENIKNNLLKMILESEDVDYSHLDDLVQALYEDENYIAMLTKFYLSFFVTTHQIPIEDLITNVGRLNLFQIKTLIEDAAKEVGAVDALYFYVDLLKEMNKNYQSNAIQVIKGIMDNSEELLEEVAMQIKELSSLKIVE